VPLTHVDEAKEVSHLRTQWLDSAASDHRQHDGSLRDHRRESRQVHQERGGSRSVIAEEITTGVEAFSGFQYGAAHAFSLSQAKPKKSTVTTLAQIMPTTKGFPELSKSGLSLSISDTNA
jgi:hypothetical protein